MQNTIWQKFGLKDNPFETNPLVEGGLLPIEKAFVGRTQEISDLNDFFTNYTHGCIAICGGVGVGKTSLINYQKHIWKTTKSDKERSLFSFRNEIEAKDTLLTKKNFLLEILGATLREMELIDKRLANNDLISKIKKIVDLYQTIDFNADIAGFGLGTSTVISQPDQIPVATLEKYFHALIDFIKNHAIKNSNYSGMIIHVNNFDVIMEDDIARKKITPFFNEVRDLLQSESVYFVFLGPQAFYRTTIAPSERVKSIFGGSISLDPLSRSDIIQAIKARMELLKSENVEAYIEPVQDEVIGKLYDIYNGDFRQVMRALTNIMYQAPDMISPLTMNEALAVLIKYCREQIDNKVNNRHALEEVLNAIIENNGAVSQKIIAKNTAKDPSNTSRYFNELADKGIVELIQIKGKEKHWDLAPQYIPLRYQHEIENNIKSDQQRASQQLSLFSKRI